ncbi:hypothetical protein [Glutamicibacter uratoxydans]|uniref:hypothetical protein n=1 Tax=Glutamicibacter uratoxydans TaxID=43667 RepID=UPI003D6FCB3E
MSDETIEMQPWDERPKFAALNTAANILYNSQLAGRPSPSIHEQIARYSSEGATEVLLENYRRGVAEERRLAARVSRIHASGRNVFGYLYSDSIHGSGQSIPANHMVNPLLSPVLALAVQQKLEHPDVNPAKILASCNSVFFGLLISSQRSEKYEKISYLECLADNAQATHLVIAPQHQPLAGFDFDSHVATLTQQDAELAGHPAQYNLAPNALAHLTESVRESILHLGPVEPGELLILPGTAKPMPFPLDATASARAIEFGTSRATHASAEFEEGFIPLESV